MKQQNTSNLITLPHSKESEMMVLGCMLTDNNNLKIGIDLSSDDDFYFTHHQVIYQALKQLYDQNKPADLYLIIEELRSSGKLQSVGGISYLVQLAQLVGTSCHIEEYIQILKKEANKRKALEAASKVKQQILKNELNLSSILKQAKESFESVEIPSKMGIPILSMQRLLKDHDFHLSRFRGKKYLGLQQKTIPIIDEMFLGLRKHILLAAPPNVGKTALGIQLAIDVVRNEPSACMVFFSLEMPAQDILTRIRCYLSGMDYRTFVFGNADNDIAIAHFNPKEIENIDKANQELVQLGERIQIIDSSMCPKLNAKQAISYITNLKKQTKCNRVIVIVDYLQIRPITEKLPLQSELELDKWRIAQIKQIRDAIQEDPILVISEARKPNSSTGGKWGKDVSDIMGSARAAYSPDAVILYTPIGDEELCNQWAYHRLKDPKLGESNKCESKGQLIKHCLAKHGIAIYRIDIAKGRDGMEKGHFYIEFHFHKNTFKQLDWGSLKSSPLQKDLF